MPRRKAFDTTGAQPPTPPTVDELEAEAQIRKFARDLAKFTADEARKARRRGVKTGRAPKLRDHAAVTRLLCAVRKGMPKGDACSIAEIGPRAVDRWLALGGMSDEDVEEGRWPEICGGYVPAAIEPYRRFRRGYARALSDGKRELVDAIRRAAPKDWRAARALLAARDPESFGHRQRHDVAGVEDAPVGVQIYLPAEDGEGDEEQD